MQVSINANICDQQTRIICDNLQGPLKAISKYLSKEYGGDIEHLWIDFELNSSHAESQPPFAFRFQKRVSGRSKLTGIDMPVKFNVGHYSVRPDFFELLQVSDVVAYALQLIYDSTTVLIDRQKKLGGFDALKFRLDFLKGCQKLGYLKTLETNIPT